MFYRQTHTVCLLVLFNTLCLLACFERRNKTMPFARFGLYRGLLYGLCRMLRTRAHFSKRVLLRRSCCVSCVRVSVYEPGLTNA